MKARHIFLLIGVAAILVALASCSLFGIVSIDDRIATFQSDLNSATRTAIYQDFHPTLTADYSALKDPKTTIDPLIPPVGNGPAYVLTITDETSPSTGVLVTITGGTSGYFPTPQYLSLVMDVTGPSDHRIVALELSDTKGSFTGTPQIQ
jgi:hypothetical protein